MTQAILVVGPESSGTRMWTDLMCQGGAVGTPSHTQPLDDHLPPAKQPIVWRRSFPHGGAGEHGIDRHWPSLLQMTMRVQGAGYTPHIVICNRDWLCMAFSQVRLHLADDMIQAFANIERAYDLIYRGLPEGELKFPQVAVSYEAVVQHRDRVQDWVLAEVGLNREARIDVYDGNARYYAER